MKKLILPLLLACTLLLGGCGAQKTYEIVATTAPVWQFANAVCEDTGLEVGLVVSDSVSCLHDYTLSVLADGGYRKGPGSHPLRSWAGDVLD